MLASSVHLKLHMKSENITQTHIPHYTYTYTCANTNSTSHEMYYFGITSSCVVRSSRRVDSTHPMCWEEAASVSPEGASNWIKSCLDTTTAIQQIPVWRLLDPLCCLPSRQCRGSSVLRLHPVSFHKRAETTWVKVEQYLCHVTHWTNKYPFMWGN